MDDFRKTEERVVHFHGIFSLFCQFHNFQKILSETDHTVYKSTSDPIQRRNSVIKPKETERLRDWFYVKRRRRCKQTKKGSDQKSSQENEENEMMEQFLKKSLNLKNVKATNQFGGGCISQGQTFNVDDDKKIYVKQNSEAIVSTYVGLFDFTDLFMSGLR